MLRKKDPKNNSVPNIAELRAACKCFKCREPWVLGHAKTCKAKQVYFFVILVENAEGQEEVAVVDDNPTSEEGEYHDAQPHLVLNICMHALCGTLPDSNTFSLKVQIGKKTASALVDTRSDVSFINAKFAGKSKCQAIEFKHTQEQIPNTNH